jgi:hypothetical protein
MDVKEQAVFLVCWGLFFRQAVFVAFFYQSSANIP